MTVQSPPPPPSYGAPAPAPKKGLSPLAWVGIGCGVLLVLALIAVIAGGMFVKSKVEDFAENPEMAAVELMIKANPELELVESDREAGTMTIRNKQTNETITVNYEDIKEGRIEFETEEGTSSIDMTGGEDGGEFTVTDANGQTSTFSAGTDTGSIPDWIPAYPGGEAQGAFAATGPDGNTGGFAVATSDSPTEVLDFYESKLEEAGFTVQKSTYTSGDGSGGTISAESENRQVGVMVGTADGGTTATVTYTDKSQ